MFKTEFTWQGSRNGRIQTQDDLMSNPIRAWPYKVGGGRSVGVGGRQVREGRVEKGEGRTRRGVARNCIQDSPCPQLVKLRLLEAGLGLARMNWPLSVVLSANSSSTRG